MLKKPSGGHFNPHPLRTGIIACGNYSNNTLPGGGRKSGHLGHFPQSLPNTKRYQNEIFQL